MKIHLVNYTPSPKKAIASFFLNMGIGKSFTSLDQISEEEASDALKEIFKSHLDAPLEAASFQFFWEDIPIFMREQLVRHRVGWSFASRSFRFFDINKSNPIKNYDWDAIPTINREAKKEAPFFGKNLKDIMGIEMNHQLEMYNLFLKEGVSSEDARNIIGVWVGTFLQTNCTYRALRAMMADRLSSQAHIFWQKAAKQIKQLITEIDKDLGNGLVDSCEIMGRCVWRSKYDRDCEACIKRGTQTKHEHKWTRDTIIGLNSQCDCGEWKPINLISNG
jgi:flavin-dependent thymidylate synthase